MLLGAVSFLLVVLVVIALLFPGWTVDRIVPVNQLAAVRFHLYLFVILASSERVLAREARTLRFLARTRSPRRLRRIDRAVSLLAETRLYRVEPVRLVGLYTLFLLGSDFLALLSLRDVRRMDPRLRLPGQREKYVTGTPAAALLSAGRP